MTFGTNNKKRMLNDSSLDTQKIILLVEDYYGLSVGPDLYFGNQDRATIIPLKDDL